MPMPTDDSGNAPSLRRRRPSLTTIMVNVIIVLTFVVERYQPSSLGKNHNGGGDKDRNANNTDPMLPCEFCDGLVPMRKLLEHQVSTVK